MQEGPFHESLKPLSWLVGKWRSVNASGDYPTLKPFNYFEEITFKSIGQPILNYESRTWHHTTRAPLHLESGFLQINPGSSQVAFMVAHNLGLNSLEEGNVENHHLQLRSVQISRASFAKEPAVTALNRSFKLDDTTGQLEVLVFMQTNRTPLTEHLKAVYEKVSE